MAPMKKKMAISQEGFDAAVKENMEDFDMDLAEAVQDAVKTFQIQGADLSAAIDARAKEAQIRELKDKGTELLLPATELELLSLKVAEDNTLLTVPAPEEQQQPQPLPIRTDLLAPEIRVNVAQDKENDEPAIVHSPSDIIDGHSARIIYSHINPVPRKEPGIITDGSNIGKADYVHPVKGALHELEKSLLLLRLEDGSYINWEDKQAEPQRVETLFEASIEALEKLAKLCVKSEPENAQIAVKNGGLEASIQAYYALQTYRMSWGSLAFRVLLSLITEEQGKEAFLKANGPKVALEALAIENLELYEPMNRELSCVAANVMAVAATQNETVKEKFMELGADAALVRYLKNHAEEMGSDGAALQAACDAIRSLTTSDDDRPAASNCFKNAMKIAKAGAMDAFVEILPQKSKALPILPSLCLTLKSLAVNDEICRGFAEEGGLNMVLEFLDYASKYPNKVVARTSCALLSQLAGSDANKEAIVKNDGLQKIIHLMKIYSEEPSVLQEGFAAITTLTLRSPQHVTKAVEAGALDVAVEMMEAHKAASPMIRQASQMVRNLNVRNPENRPLSLEKGLEPLLRRAKDTHENCKDVASAALRDLGLDDYL